MQNQTPPLILTFGTTDPVGAIGIQADIASFSAMGCHGLSVITSILIADTAHIEDSQAIDADWVDDQARVILEDMSIAAFKVGSIGSIDNISAIAEILADYPNIPLVLDRFISSMPNQETENEDILIAIRELLIPQTTLLLISSVELNRLAETWREPSLANDINADIKPLIESGCEYVLVTDVPSSTLHEITNILFNETGIVRNDSWQRIAGHFNGAGSTLSAAITALLAKGADIPKATLEGQEFLLATLAHAQRLGMGKLIPDRSFAARESVLQSH